MFYCDLFHICRNFLLRTPLGLEWSFIGGLARGKSKDWGSPVLLDLWEKHAISFCVPWLVESMRYLSTLAGGKHAVSVYSCWWKACGICLLLLVESMRYLSTIAGGKRWEKKKQKMIEIDRVYTWIPRNVIWAQPTWGQVWAASYVLGLTWLMTKNLLTWWMASYWLPLHRSLNDRKIKRGRISPIRKLAPPDSTEW